MKKAFCDKCRKEIKINLLQFPKNTIFVSFHDNKGKYNDVEQIYCKKCYKTAKENVMAGLLNEDG